MASIASAVGNLDGDLAEADAAEERLVEEMRLLGRAALQGWADERVVATEQEIRQQPGMHGNGKKLCWHTKFGEIEVLVHFAGNPNPVGPLMPPVACLSSSSGTALPS